MLNIIVKLTEILNMIKGFEAGCSTRFPDKMIIDLEGKRYVIQIHEVKHKSDSILDDLDRLSYI